MRVPVIRNITVRTADGRVAWVLDKEQTSAHEFFFYIECVCNAWFTFEILVSNKLIAWHNLSCYNVKIIDALN